MGIRAKIASRITRAYLAQQSFESLQSKLMQRRGVLVLCYHALAQELSDYPYRTTPQAFARHLDFLREIFDIVSLQDAVEILSQGSAVARSRPIAAISFDDGYACNGTDATPVLETANIPATLFAAKAMIMAPGQSFLSLQALQDLSAHALWSIGAHGVSHTVLPGLRLQDQMQELQDCHFWLSDLLGHAPAGFAYPQGQHTAEISQRVAGVYDFACSTDQRASQQFSRYQIRRYCPVQADDDLMVFARNLLLCAFETGVD